MKMNWMKCLRRVDSLVKGKENVMFLYLCDKSNIFIVFSERYLDYKEVNPSSMIKKSFMKRKQ